MNQRRPTKPPLRILQVNVGRSAQAQELALAAAHEERIDVLLIQEPYIFHDLARQITRRHPGFDCFTPTDDWAYKPRVFTLVRKGIGLKPEQIRPLGPFHVAARDLLFISLLSPRQQKLLTLNIYNAPAGANNERAALDAVLNDIHCDIFPPLSLIAGDLNLHHRRWEPGFDGGMGAAEPLVAWMDENGFDLATGQNGVPTHDRGHV
ncbi:hypothetical protein K3495_g16625, partial [Podosphaera aphanis]